MHCTFAGCGVCSRQPSPRSDRGGRQHDDDLVWGMECGTGGSFPPFFWRIKAGRAGWGRPNGRPWGPRGHHYYLHNTRRPTGATRPYKRPTGLSLVMAATPHRPSARLGRTSQLVPGRDLVQAGQSSPKRPGRLGERGGLSANTRGQLAVRRFSQVAGCGLLFICHVWLAAANSREPRSFTAATQAAASWAAWLALFLLEAKSPRLVLG